MAAVGADIEDIVAAHLLAMEQTPSLGFERYIISASTLFTCDDLRALRADAPSVVGRHLPRFAEVYAARGWKMFPTIDRVYVNERARRELGWRPRYDFGFVVDRIDAGEDHRSELAQSIGSKGYHEILFEDGPYPT
jgi:UDP-glucose 4-epimerase